MKACGGVGRRPGQRAARWQGRSVRSDCAESIKRDKRAREDDPRGSGEVVQVLKACILLSFGGERAVLEGLCSWTRRGSIQAKPAVRHRASCWKSSEVGF